MRVIQAADFRARCLRLMDEVAETGEPIVITKNGKPVSRLVPYREKPAPLYGSLRGMVEVKGDIVSPLDAEWGALE